MDFRLHERIIPLHRQLLAEAAERRYPLSLMDDLFARHRAPAAVSL
jgi:hypothetical protein